jgi:hypothetical protein
MRRARQWVDPARLAVYAGIIELYAPYVLVRCAGYTNGRSQAQQIGAYTLVTACLMADELGPVVPLGRVVEIALGVVGPDVMSGAPGDPGPSLDDELLIVDRRMRRMAAALNALKRPCREVLVLHYVTGVERADLARLLQEPAGEVRAKIRRGERLLARRLEGLPGQGDKAAVDISSRLTQFAAALDTGWMQEVAGGALAYLARQARRGRSRPACPDWN